MKSRKKQGNSFGIDSQTSNIFYYLNEITDVKQHLWDIQWVGNEDGTEFCNLVLKHLSSGIFIPIQRWFVDVYKLMMGELLADFFMI